ncbi:MAG: TIGR03546 family protein [Candidatus Anammoximicrobium sp.]|nr:TIGR03546 family protein [Candidatus Anammoximicrobium sp.]
MLWFIKPVRFLVAALRDLNSPRRIAWAVALGMVVGLVPKDNLTAAALGTLLLTVRINLAAGTCTALACACLAAFCDPFTDRLGYALLTAPALTPYWNGLFQWPAAAWTGLNNTIVVGSLALGLWLFYPVYFLTSRGVRRLQERYGARLSERLQKYRLYQLLWGVDLSASWSWKR